MDYFDMAAPLQSYHYPPFGIESSLSTEHDEDAVDKSPIQLDSSYLFPNSIDYQALDNDNTSTPYPASAFLINSAISSRGRAFVHELSHASTDSGIGLDGEPTQGDRDAESADPDRLRRGSEVEEKGEPATPAQRRRKAQNRAAQRAFRERKERHVRDLEAQLSHVTASAASLQSDNERLKMLLQRTRTENEMLRSNRAAASTSNPRRLRRLSAETAMLDDDEDNDRDDEWPPNDSTQTSTHVRAESKGARPVSWTRPLDAGATWDLLQAHPLFISGAVDVGEVCERLKKCARCEGGGPMFDEPDVRRVIEEVANGSGQDLTGVYAGL